MSPLTMLLIVAWAASAIALIILILMHSGKGTGVSDMIASSMYNAAAGSATWEKNLDRLTVIFGIVFAVTIFAMMLVFPQGSFA